MGADGARKIGAAHLRAVSTRDRNRERLGAIGELVRMHRNLERALEQAPDAELAQIAAAARQGERVLEDWARRIEVFRAFKRRYEAGIHPADGTSPRAAGAPVAGVHGVTLAEPRRLPFLWELVAFVAGFAISMLLT
jgi:hypothetical protein